MKNNLLAHNMGSFPSFRFPFSLREEGEAADMLQHFHESSGLTISEDKKHLYVEAAVPGHTSEEIEMTFEQGTLWIQSTKKEEKENKKKFYRKAMSSFSYRVAIPTDIDETKPPESICINGILTVVFVKKKKSIKIRVNRL